MYKRMNRYKPCVSVLAGLLCLALLCGFLSSCMLPGEPEDSSADTEVTESSWMDTTDVTDEEITTESEDSTGALSSVEDSSAGESESASEPEIDSDPESGSESGSEIESEPESTTPPIPPEETPKEDLPHIDIYTEGGQSVSSTEYYVNATISTGNCFQEYILTNCPAGIRVRGNSTAVVPKKPYRIKFETKQSLFGLNDGEAFKSWCLMADFYDHSMLRTWSTFAFADILMEGKYYSSDCTPVEVYVNNEYQGVYLLCEQTQIDNDRINIFEAREGDTSVEIGYLMIGQGGRTDEPESIVVRPEITVWDRNGASMYFEGLNFALSGSGYTQEQKDYVTTYVSAVFKVVAAALYDNTYYNLARDGTMTLRSEDELAGMTTEGKQISTIDAVFNIESAVGMCVLDEIVKNLDAMTFNMYVDLSPRGDGRLTLAAPWDFDFSMANTHYPVLHSTSGFYATNLSVSDGMRTNLWFVMFGRIDWFERMCEELWQEHYGELCDVAREVLVRSYRYMDCYDRDWERWGAASKRAKWSGHHCTDDLNTYTRHLDAGRFVNSWLEARLIWLNRQWGDKSTIQPAPSQPLLEVDFVAAPNLAYISGAYGCNYTSTDDGLRLRATDGQDPYFYIDYTKLAETYAADDYYMLEIEYMIPATNGRTEYEAEFFLCAGSQWGAQAGVSVVSEMGKADGTYRTLRIDLSKTAFWSGDIHKIRFDFFSGCAEGDVMLLRSFKLLPN